MPTSYPFATAAPSKSTRPNPLFPRIAKYILATLLCWMALDTVYAQAPSAPATNLAVSNLDGDRFYISFIRGNGTRRLVIASQDPVTAVPQDGTDYVAGNFGLGNEIAPGQFVVAIGTSNGFWVHGLNHSTTYHFRVYEYNGENFETEYLTADFLQGSASTLTAPAEQASGIQFTNVRGAGMTVSWQNGSGTGRMLIARAGTPVDVEPQDLTGYSSSSAFGSREIGNGNYILHHGSGNSRAITGLDPNVTYHFALFEYNGNNTNSRVFHRPSARASQLTPSKPTVPASNIQTSNLDGDRFYYYMSAGNGERRVVIAKEGSAVTAVPADGTSYTHHTTFGHGTEISPGEFVVYDGASNQSWLYGLDPAKTYHLAVYEYNGTGTDTFYLTTSLLRTSATTLGPPITQASDIQFTNVTGSGMTVNWQNGTGAGRMLIARAGVPVGVEPQDFTNYNWSSAFGTREIGDGNYILHYGTGSSRAITGLDPNVTYHFALFEYSGSSARQFLRPGVRASQLTPSKPTVPASNIQTSNLDGDRFYYYMSRGNGERRVVIAKEGSAVTAVPADGTSYTHHTTFGQGTEISPGEFVVYDGASNQSWLYGLDPAKTYHLAVYEYNGTGTDTFYLTTSLLRASATTLGPPITQASNIQFANVTGSGMTVSWQNGTGAGRMLIARAGAPVDVEPQDLTNYSWSSAFGSREIGDGNYILHYGTGSSRTISNLDPNVTYHFALFEYSGSSARQFLRPGVLASQLTSSKPTVPASNLQTSNAEGDRFYYYMSAGNGERRVVIAKEGSAVTAAPADGTSYTHHTTFGQGTEISPGEFVVYDGTSNQSWLYGLDPAKTYHLAVYEYNGTATDTYYLTTAFLQANATTLSPPTVQSSSAFLSSRSNTSMNISWTRGNGTHRILIGRKDGPVNVEPQDGTNYTASTTFGNREIGTSGNFVLYGGTGNNVNVTNLEPGTNYYFALFEYNGSNQRMYMTPGYAFALETLGERPTEQVSNAAYSNIDFNAFDVSFTPGNGSRRLVLAREGSAVSGGPADFSDYAANSAFGEGDQIGAGNYVVYNGTGDAFTVSGLEPGKTYHLAFFEYALSDAGELYMAPAYSSSQSSKFSVDLSVSAIVAPESGCGLSAEETVTVEVSNLSPAAVGAFQVAYTINGGTPVVEDIPGTNTIAANGKLVYDFSQKADFSAYGTYELVATVIFEEDIDETNNSLAKTIVTAVDDADITISPDVEICAGNTVALQAGGGTAYLWSNGARTATINVSPATNTVYTVVVTTAGGCQVERSVEVTVAERGEQPVISSAGASCDGEALLRTQLGFAVHWSLQAGGQTHALGESLTLDATQPGVYTASYTNMAGCEVVSEPFTFSLADRPVLEVSGLTTICLGDATTLSVPGLDNVLWSDGQTSPSITVSPTANTRYTVTGTYGNGCAFADSIDITVIPATNPEPVSQMLPADGSVNITQPISLSWLPGDYTVTYDVYVWEEEQTKPTVPSAADIQSIDHAVSGLDAGTSYLWQVHAKNGCGETAGPVQGFQAAGLPDLTIPTHSAPESITAGNKITVTWEVQNSGAGNTNNARWKDRIWLSADMDLRKADDILLGEFDNPSSLMAGESYTMNREVTVPMNLNGIYYLFVITDNEDGYCRIENGVCVGERGKHSDSVVESDEQNNFSVQTLSITPAIITGISLADGSFVYDGTQQALAIDGNLPEGTTVTYSGNGRTNVGTQEVTATVSGDNYQELVLVANLQITPATITSISLADGRFAYDGTQQTLAIGGNLPEGATVTYSGNGRTNVGTQEVTATVSGDNYQELVLTANLQITPATITSISLADGRFVYDGTQQALAIDGSLPEGATVTYSGNGRTNVGSQEVTATVSGDNYQELVLAANLQITPATITGISLADGRFAYDGTQQTLAIGGNLPEGATVTYSGNGRTSVGIQEVTATISGHNYQELVLTANLQITPATITGISLADGRFAYDGTRQTLAIGGNLPEGATVTYSGNGRTNVGSQEVTATVSGDNYQELVLTASLQITPATITGISLADGSFVYNGTQQTLAIGGNLPEGATVTYSGNGRTNVGTQEVTATVSGGNYQDLVLTANLQITPATQTITLNIPAQLNRNAGSVSLDVSASSGLPVSLSIDNPEVVSLSGTVLNVLRLGTVNITATQAGDGNYQPATPVTVSVRVWDPNASLPVRVHPAVSPNGDGINDFLMIEGIKDYPDNRVTIFNRNGTVVWEASGYDNDRTAFRGVGTGQMRVPAGTYFYIIDVNDGGTRKYEKGYFVLRY